MNNSTSNFNKVPATTGVFPASPNTAGLKQVNDGFAVGNVQRSVTEKTFKKRMAKFAASKGVLVLAILFSLSAILSCFRGYMLPLTLFLVAERVAVAATLWTVFFTAGKRGLGFFSLLPVLETVAAVVLMCFMAAFVGCALYGKQLLLGGKEDLVRLIYNAGTVAVIPGLLCIMTAYCIFLFKRHQRLIACNLRDGARYGFSFDKGAYVFARNCVIVAVAMPAAYIAFGLLPSFKSLGFSEGGAALLSHLFHKGSGYWLNLIGIGVHSTALCVAGSMTVRYAYMVKKFRQQKEAAIKEEKAALEGINELKQIEEEKAQSAKERKNLLQ